MTKAKFLRILAVFGAGYLPYAFLWRSTGTLTALLVGAAVALAAALVIRWREAGAGDPH
ncbi:hypothetical protein [Arthrobacter sp. Soil763]|uniref:hypothetical protein n=1 Tax=Arthrobacter sp. Soil763 TaxID=1736402 RepID=UPI0012FC7F8E|nr:hypothetical protein [Arthrobacter sp. Soil763]